MRDPPLIYYLTPVELAQLAAAPTSRLADDIELDAGRMAARLRRSIIVCNNTGTECFYEIDPRGRRTIIPRIMTSPSGRVR